MHCGSVGDLGRRHALLDRPLDLWVALFGAFDRIGEAICPSGWYASLLGAAFPDGVAVLFNGLAHSGGSIDLAEEYEQVWRTLSPRFRLDDATEPQLGHLRGQTDRDVRLAVDKLVALGALTLDKALTVSLTPLSEWALRRPYTVSKAGDPIAALSVTLLDTQPPIWRRLLVSASIRLDRLHDVIQAAMGWQDYHLHVFTKGADQYGEPDRDDDF